MQSCGRTHRSLRLSQLKQGVQKPVPNVRDNFDWHIASLASKQTKTLCIFFTCCEFWIFRVGWISCAPLIKSYPFIQTVQATGKEGIFVTMKS